MFRLSITAVLLQIAISAHALSQPLFRLGQRSANYAEILENASRNGGYVSFSNQSTFALKGEVARSEYLRAYGLEDGKILYVAGPGPASSAQDALQVFVSHHTLLASQGVQVAPIADVGPLIKNSTTVVEYLLLEASPEIYSLADWIASIGETSTPLPLLDRTLPEGPWNALKAFAKSTWRFVVIGELSPQSIIWTGERWVLKHGHGVNFTLTDSDSRTVFSTHRWRTMPREQWKPEEAIFSILDDVVRQERTKHNKCDSVLGG